MRKATLSITGLALGLVLSVSVAPGQTTPPPAPPPTPSPGGPPSTGSPRIPTPTPPTPGQTRQQQPDFNQQETQMQRGIFLSGKVMLDDGTPPPDSVVIERVCNGNPRPEAYTDSKGRFSFQLGQNNAMMADASISGMGSGMPGMSSGRDGAFGTGRGSVQLMGCELRASLAGFRSDSIDLSGRRLMDDPNVGTIVLHRLGNVEGTTISATSLQAPKDAKKAYEKGFGAARKTKWPEAQKYFEKAVEIYPKYAAAWFELGRAYQEQKNIPEARKAYAQALSADAKFLKPYVQIATIAVSERKWDEVAKTTDQVLRLDPVDYPIAYYYNSVAHFNLHDLDTAEKSAREGLKLDTNHRMPAFEHVLGVILANRQDYVGAAQFMRSYLQRVPDGQNADVVRKQLADIEKLSGQTAKQ